MLTALSRIIKYGILGFIRNGWLSTVTISIMILVLVVFEGLVLFKQISDTALVSLKDKVDISVYFKNITPEDNILQTQRALETLAEVKEVEYISREKALEIFKQRHEDDPAITQSLDILKDSQFSENPLLASLNIKAHDPKEYANIASYLNESNFKEWFEKEPYTKNAVVIERLSRIIDTAERGGIALMIFLAAIAVLVTFNTIRLAIYSSRDEIGIMRLVGASNTFIRGPYVIEGIVYGSIAGILSVALMAPLAYAVSPYLKVFIPEMSIWTYFYTNLFIILGYQMILGMILGIVSSSIAVRKYLKI